MKYKLRTQKCFLSHKIVHFYFPPCRRLSFVAMPSSPKHDYVFCWHIFLFASLSTSFLHKYFIHIWRCCPLRFTNLKNPFRRQTSVRPIVFARRRRLIRRRALFADFLRPLRIYGWPGHSTILRNFSITARRAGSRPTILSHIESFTKWVHARPVTKNLPPSHFMCISIDILPGGWDYYDSHLKEYY